MRDSPHASISMCTSHAGRDWHNKKMQKSTCRFERDRHIVSLKTNTTKYTPSYFSNTTLSIHTFWELGCSSVQKTFTSRLTCSIAAQIEKKKNVRERKKQEITLDQPLLKAHRESSKTNFVKLRHSSGDEDQQYDFD